MPLRYRLGRTLEYLLVPAKRRCHSPGAKKGFVIGEVLRLLSINSSRSTFNKNRHLFKILLNYKKKKANKPNKANLCLSHVINFPNSLYFTQWKALLSSKAKRFCSLKLWDECFTFMIQQNKFFQKIF